MAEAEAGRQTECKLSVSDEEARAKAMLAWRLAGGVQQNCSMHCLISGSVSSSDSTLWLTPIPLSTTRRRRSNYHRQANTISQSIIAASFWDGEERRNRRRERWRGDDAVQAALMWTA